VTSLVSKLGIRWLLWFSHCDLLIAITFASCTEETLLRPRPAIGVVAVFTVEEYMQMGDCGG
jgi:hypothetical protein